MVLTEALALHETADRQQEQTTRTWRSGTLLAALAPTTDWELLQPTSFHTSCPFKGEASYWSAEVGGKRHDGIVWAYEAPIPTAAEIAGLLSFHPKDTEIKVNGEILAA